ncbi:MAG: hypothetical protein LDL47_04895 [Cyanobacteria bacterium KgW148]|nr:hypothetical protein [Cyanobacteria bacterium KgW148]
MNNSDWQARLVAALPYLLPLTAVMPIGVYFFQELPFLLPLFMPLLWLHRFLNFPILSFISLDTVLFFVVYGLVVRSDRFRRSVRVNGMQALLLSIVVFISSLLLRWAGAAVPLLGQVLANTTFIGIVAASVWGMGQGIRGEVATLPGISEAAQIQVR